VFHLGIEQYENVNYIVSNLPDELIQSFTSDAERALIISSLEMDYSTLLKTIACRVFKNNISKYFFYSNFLQVKNEEEEEVRFAQIRGFEIEPGLYLSENSYPLKFHVLKYQYYLSYYFMREEFNKECQISTREEYERNLINKQSEDDYLDIYSSTNIFLKADEPGISMYILLDKGVPFALNAV